MGSHISSNINKKEYHKNGMISKDYNIRSNVLNGPYTEYYDNGTPSYQCIYVNDKLTNNKFKSWYRDGSKQKCAEEDGDCNFTYKEWTPAGNLKNYTYLKNSVYRTVVQNGVYL
jgi:antitoxin component YwqK of YwqJK toxin-antitoxin module